MDFFYLNHDSHIFFMFCCFSTKKKKHQRKPQLPLPTKDNNKKSRRPPKPCFEPIVEKSHEQSTHNNKLQQTHLTRKHDDEIDRMIKEEIELEETESEQKHHRKRQIKHPKFSDIQNDDENFLDKKLKEHKQKEDCSNSSEESQVDTKGTKRKFKVTLSFDNMGTLAMQSKALNSLDLDEAEAQYNKREHHATQKEFLENFSDGCSSIQPQQSAITLNNFYRALQQIPQKMAQQLDEPLQETFEEAENGFFCREGSIQEQFSRSVIAYSSPHLAISLLNKMTKQQKNKIDSKGYAPVHLVVKKALKQKEYNDLAKIMAYHEDIDLECRNLSGWTPLQEALLYRNIPLSTHLFQAGYRKRQLSFRRRLAQLAEVLDQMPNFTIEIEVQIDSFIPLVGALAPSDTLKIKKVGGRIRLDYSLVGYNFPMCKRREMSIFFDGTSMLGLNSSKGIYCDLLEDLDQQQMILLVEDLLTSQVKRGEPIIHEVSLTKSLSLFDNEITQQIGDVEATKYQLNLRYTSTAQKRKSILEHEEDLAFVSNYGDYQQRKEQMVIKEKNRNKRMELEVWLAKKFGLDLQNFINALQILGAGNNLLSKWSSFLKDKIGQKMEQSNLFPVKIEIPLNYSLYFNIEFHSLAHLPPDSPSLELPQSLQKVTRKKFQGLLESRDKRKLLLEAYT